MSDFVKKLKKLSPRLLAALFWLAVWQLAAMAVGHGGLLLPGPVQTVAALLRLVPTAGYWRRVGFSTVRILLGFVLAVAGGVLLGAASARWGTVRLLAAPPLQLLRAMPVASFVILALLWVRSAWLSVLVSFTQVLPVVYAGVCAGIGDTDKDLLEMARVFRLSPGKTLRHIWLPGVFPAFAESLSVAMGMCWKSGVSAEVIGLPDWSVGDALYRAKLTLSTPDVFAWTLTIVLLSALLAGMARRGLAAAKHRLCGEVSA